jgi:hypothetical protein
MAANGYENAAGLRIPAPGIVCQATVAQVMAVESHLISRRISKSGKSISFTLKSSFNFTKLSEDSLICGIFQNFLENFMMF